ncbi:MAG: dTDP-4-dehydrorhamnose 3,5-epimerase [Muribaculaceae bacterium]|nr:dTDP-4-dehydrorhamnose 3,5-epimerase [Muribaculaceae bacterium]
MKVTPTKIEGVFIIEPRVFLDERGYFFESFSKRVFEEHIGKVNFVQDNESCSTKGVIRGLHFQRPPYSQAKLVRCVVGKVRDVAVDLRKDSPTFGQYVAVELSEENHLQFFIPKGFAHGFEVLSDVAVFQYKCDEYYHPESDGGILAFDPQLNIEWFTSHNEAVISDKDKKHPRLSEFDSPF